MTERKDIMDAAEAARGRVWGYWMQVIRNGPGLDDTEGEVALVDDAGALAKANSLLMEENAILLDRMDEATRQQIAQAGRPRGRVPAGCRVDHQGDGLMSGASDARLYPGAGVAAVVERRRTILKADEVEVGPVDWADEGAEWPKRYSTELPPAPASDSLFELWPCSEGCRVAKAEEPG